MRCVTTSKLWSYYNCLNVFPKERELERLELPIGMQIGERVKEIQRICEAREKKKEAMNERDWP